jgi:hypothetical protein
LPCTADTDSAVSSRISKIAAALLDSGKRR